MPRHAVWCVFPPCFSPFSFFFLFFFFCLVAMCRMLISARTPMLCPLPPQVYAGAVHAVDWMTTFAALAGAALPAGVRPGGGSVDPDGVSLWPGSLANLSHYARTEVLLSIETGHNRTHTVPNWREWGVLRVGQHKLITQNVNWDYDYHLGWTHDCLLGTGGGWGQVPTNGTDL